MLTDGCLRTTTNILSVLAKKTKITADIRQKRATIVLASRTKKPNHLLRKKLHFWLIEQQSHLKSICACYA